MKNRIKDSRNWVMLKLLCVILVAVIVTIFAFDNMHHVELDLFIGGPKNVRLFFLLLISFLVGCFTTVIIDLYTRVKYKKKTEITQDTEEDDFFSD